VQRLRDEAHRFAITFQRQQRSSAIQSELSAIPGLGEERVRRLLKHFGSAKRVRAASPEQIAEVQGFGPGLAEQVFTSLRTDTVEDEGRGGS
ncbi:helix-hairpin-helix domain-containing protein, partial [Agrococcus jejuensis]